MSLGGLTAAASKAKGPACGALFSCAASAWWPRQHRVQHVVVAHEVVEQGGAVPLWGGDVAKKVNYLEQGGSLWVFKLMK